MRKGRRTPGKALVVTASVVAGLLAPAFAPSAGAATLGTTLSGFTSFSHMLVAGGRVFVSPGSGGSAVAELGLDDAAQGSLTGLSGPSGLATEAGVLYVAETDASRIATFDLSTDPPTAGATFDVSAVGAPVDLTVAGGKLWFATTATCGVTPGKLGSVDLDGSNVTDQTPGPAPAWTDCPALDWSGFAPNALFLRASSSSAQVLTEYDVSSGSPVLVASGDLGGTYEGGAVTVLPSGTQIAVTTTAGVGTFAIDTFAASTPTYSPGQDILAASAAAGGLLLGGLGSTVEEWRVGNATAAGKFVFPSGSGSLWLGGFAFDGTGKRLFTAVGAPTGVTIVELYTAQKPTSLKLSLSATKVGPGTPVKATAHLKGGGRGAVVTIYVAKAGGTWKKLASGKVNKHGNFAATFTPTRNTFVMAVFAGDVNWAAAKSKRHEVYLLPNVAVTGPKPDKPSTNGYHLYYPHPCYVSSYGYPVGCIPITATVTPNLAGQPITLVLQAYQNGAWKTVDTKKLYLSSKSKAVLWLGSSKADSYRIGTPQRVMAIFPKTAYHLASSSAWFYLEVIPFG